MLFIALTFALVVAGVALAVVFAKVFEGHRVADLLDWQPTRSPEVEAQNEIDDVRQMIEAQNAYRRRRGAPEITRADVERQAAEDNAVRARGSGPFTGNPVVDELDAPPRKRRTSRPKK